MLVASLQRVDDAQHFGGVAASGGRVREDGTDLLVRVDDEDGTNCEGDALLVYVRGVLVVDPANYLVSVFPKSAWIKCDRVAYMSYR